MNVSPFKIPKDDSPDSSIRITPIDLSKRYDIYCSLSGEDRVYEDVTITGIRTLEPKTQFSSGLLGGYIEIEARNGSRVMIPHVHINMLCEHGLQPTYRVLRTHKTDG